ncbi:NACHT, LRR and PYD domains-containing protein 11 [Myotis myotis]|uniref:NACHT, LRR and PYD domains-containing protein 11 n=1 Tax=Myotis myotis TaxID=51298 RepID=UPI00174BB16F|nr:NACHT, LRR and PYD domains-containing protein 11 [Myotis myotis]
MEESDSSDSDLLWYLEKLSRKECHSLRNQLGQECMEIGLPPIPRLELSEENPDLANQLTRFYEAQHLWNLMYNIFHKIPRKDLCEKINARRNRNKEAHKMLIKKKLQGERCLHNRIHDIFCQDMILELVDKFDFVFRHVSPEAAKALNVFLIGQEASGKTMVLRGALFEWANGNIWEDVFSYVIHLSSHDINQMTSGSLVALISKDWPEGRAPVADILSEPQKILFILEDLDDMELTFRISPQALCTDGRQQVSTPVLVASLLTRKLAPGCRFLITSRPQGQAVTWTLMKKTDMLMTLSFSREKRHKYFTLFFRDGQRAEAAFQLVQRNELFLHLCQAPILCWVTCVALQRQMNQGADLKRSCQTLTDIYTHFLADTLTAQAADQRPVVPLQSLCSLALEGLLHNTLHFTEEDLRSVGFTQADVSTLQTLEILWPSSHLKGRYRFIHSKVQEFCAAVAFMLPLAEHGIPSAWGRCKGKRELYDDFSPVIASLFGLLNKERRKTFEAALGCRLLTDYVSQYLLTEMRCFGDNLKAIGHHTPMFHGLFENQEEEYVKRIMDSFSEANIYVRDHRDLMVSSYCLGYCQRLQKLKLSIQNIFEKRFNEQPTPRLTYFSVDTRFEDMFKAIVHNRNLTCLCLSCMPISSKVFSLLHEVLTNPMCSIQHLSLMKCDLEASAYQELASLLLSSKNMKKLTLSKNALIYVAFLNLPFTIRGMESSRSQPYGFGRLLFCCLTLRSLSLISRSLVLTETLKHLDVSVNNIRDNGVLVLMMSLVFPTCSVQELEISGCFFTAKACEYMVCALQNNPNLKSLELGSNNVGDAGMELLCGAMKHPNCKLENIGLEECMLTSACCASLASVLISSKTLKKINLLRNKLGNEGIVQLLEGLGHPDCVLQTVGLQPPSPLAITTLLSMTMGYDAYISFG